VALAKLRGATVKDELDLKWALATGAEAIFDGANLDEVVNELNVILDPKGPIKEIGIREELVRMLREREERLNDDL
jgi:hypothetical protein